jgi:hypothetical protein
MLLTTQETFFHSPCEHGDYELLQIIFNYL